VNVAAAAVVRDTGTVDRDNPWPGLAAFRERDRDFFYGREPAVQVLLDLVSRERVSVLYGASGLGKTSLIQAGLFPRARAKDLFPVRIRLDFARPSNLIEQIYAALLRDAVEHKVEAPPRGRGTIWEFFYRKDSLWWSDRHRLLTPLLVFDQFEEMFTIGRRTPETSAATWAVLQELRGLALGFPPDDVKARCDANPDEALQYSLARSPVHVLFSFREDYLAEFVELRAVFPAIGDNDFRLLPMSTTDGLRVILSPGGHLVSEDVAKRIVEIIAAQRLTRRKLANDLPVDPTLLSVFCRELNNERRLLGQDRITGELLKDTQETILDNFYIRSLDGIDPGVQIFIEDDLVLPDSPERNFVAEEVVLRKPGVTAAAIETLIDRRLLRRDERDGPPRIELTHDVLIDPVRRSRDVRRAREQEAQRAGAEREAEERARKAAEEEFDRQKRRRQRIFSTVVSVLLLAATALLAWALWSRRLAQRASDEAQRAKVGRTLAEASIQSVDGNHPEMGLAYIAFAARTDPDDPRTRLRLINSLMHRWWPLPLAVLPHRAGVRWAEFDKDGTQVLTLSQDGDVTVWPAASSGARVPALMRAASFARFTADGHVLVVTTAGAVEVWDSDSRQRVAAFGPADAAITAAALSPDAGFLAAGDAKGHLHVWRVSSPSQPLLTEPAYHEAIAIVQFSHDSRRLLTASGGSASIWDVPSFAPSSLEPQVAAFLSADFAPDSAHLVTTDEAGKARLWQMRGATTSGRQSRGRRPSTATITHYAAFQPNGRVFFTQFSPDGLFVVTASEDGNATIWDSVAGSPVGVPMKHGGAVVSAVFSRDNSRILTASRDGSARLWDAAGGRLAEPMWHQRPLASATFSPDGDRVVTASDDGTAEVWDVRPGAAAPESSNAGLAVSSAQFGPDERYVLFTDSDNIAHVWDRREGTARFSVSHDAVAPPQFLPDGQTILVVLRRTVEVLRIATKERVGDLMPGREPVLTARVSPDGSRIATLRDNGTVQIHDGTGAPISTLHAPVREGETQPASLAFSRDARLVAVPGAAAPNNAAADGIVRVWDLSRTSAAPREFRAPSPIVSVALSADAKWLLATGSGDAAYVFAVENNGSAPEALPLYHDRHVVSSRFNTDGTAVITTSEDATARLWKQPWHSWTPFVLRHDPPGGTATLAATTVRSGAFSRSGDRVVTSAEDGAARVWDVQTGERSALFRHPAVVTSAQFSADGDHILTACADGRARVWDLPVGARTDVPALADLAERVAGYRLNENGELVRRDAPVEALQALRVQTSQRTTAASTISDQIVAWFFADRWKRTISPFSRMTVSQFIDNQRETDALDEALRLYPGHPELRRAAAAARAGTNGEKQ
jgi:WD40 repeat protein